MDSLTQDQIDDVISSCREWAFWLSSTRKSGKILRYQEDFQASLVTIVAMIGGVGPHPKRIAEITGIDGRTVAKYGRRLERAKLWDNGQVTYRPEDVEIAAAVAMGNVELAEEELPPSEG